jgi:hypothetical protein
MQSLRLQPQLTEGNLYTFRLAAANSNGWSAYSNWVELQIEQPQCAAATKPQPFRTHFTAD